MAKIVVIGSLAESLINFRGELLTEMVSQGHEVIACAPDASENIQKQLSEKGVRYQAIPLSRTGLNPFQDIKLVVTLVSLLRQAQPDVVLGYTIKPVIFGSIAARFAGAGKIFSLITGLGYAFIGSTYKAKLINKLVVMLYRFALGFNERVFFQNPDDRASFIVNGIITDVGKTLIINGSGVNTTYFQSTPFPESISFLLISRLVKDKGVVEYVEAARVVKQKYPEVQFRLVGWHDTNPAAVSEAELHNWIEKGNIDYLGKMDDVRPAIADCSVYVLPSYREGTPRTVLEAMSMGRPVITTDAPGCRETVEEDVNGFMVPVKDVSELATKMIRFIESPALIEQMGKASRKIAVEKYDVHKVNASILRGMGLVNCKVSV